MNIALIVVVIVCVIGILGSVVLGSLLWETKKKVSEYTNRFADIIDADAELAKVNTEKVTAEKKLSAIKKVLSLEVEEARAKQEIALLENKIELLRKSYDEKHVIYKRLEDEIKIYEENLEIIEHGMHAPSFEYDSSERYKNEITKIREKQKEMIRAKTAVFAKKDWVVGGSAKEGAKMITRIVKLALRAFNGECDAAIANVKWNNLPQMEARIEKSRDAINDLISWSGCYITSDYFNLKFKELQHVYLYAEKKQEEKEAQRAAAERIREEERAQREFEKAQKEAEREEQRYNAALEQAKKDLETAQGEKLNKLNLKIEELQKKLEEAQQNKARAKSMAEQTKCGHVYVISNIGSFGENIYKIGMTRRLDPTERVKELGDASVPFAFDIHAMIYSENAPQLETALHKKFWGSRVNYVNDRREFFNIDLSEIEKVVKENGSDIEFIKIPEAKEYRETISIKDATNVEKKALSEKKEELPTAI